MRNLRVPFIGRHQQRCAVTGTGEYQRASGRSYPEGLGSNLLCWLWVIRTPAARPRSLSVGACLFGMANRTNAESASFAHCPVSLVNVVCGACVAGEQFDHKPPMDLTLVGRYLRHQVVEIESGVHWVRTTTEKGV